MQNGNLGLTYYSQQICCSRIKENAIATSKARTIWELGIVNWIPGYDVCSLPSRFAGRSHFFNRTTIFLEADSNAPTPKLSRPTGSSQHGMSKSRFLPGDQLWRELSQPGNRRHSRYIILTSTPDRGMSLYKHPFLPPRPMAQTRASVQSTPWLR